MSTELLRADAVLEPLRLLKSKDVKWAPNNERCTVCAAPLVLHPVHGHVTCAVWEPEPCPGALLYELEASLAREEGLKLGVKERLGSSTTWPLYDVLEKLAAAAEHLLDHHCCDNHGHEEVRTCSTLARGYVANRIDALFVSPTRRATRLRVG